MSTEIEDPNIVRIEARRAPRCEWCGKPGQEEKTFTATLIPGKRTPDGRRPTIETLTAETEQQVDDWKKSRYLHKQCKDPAIDNFLAVIDRLDADNERLQEIELALIERRHEPVVQQLLTTLGFEFQDDQVKTG